jgi:hypothetical protein
VLQTYKATLRGNRLEWSDTVPQAIAEDRSVAVHVTILDEVQASSAQQTSGQQMAAILEQLAHHPTLTSISDPIAWQREQRGERTLPGREE